MLIKIIILLGLFFGTLTDLKKREVLDTLSFSLILLGFVFGLTRSLIYSTYEPILYSFSGFAIGFLFGALLYYSGQWGGGDAKLIMGVGALMGADTPHSLMLFVVFLVTSLVVGAIYGIIWLVILGLKNKKTLKKEHTKINKNHKNKFFKWVLIFATFFLIIFFVIGINKQIIFLGYIIILFLTLILYSKNFLKAIENIALIKKIPLSKLTEGDWVIEEFNFKEKKIAPNKTGITQEDIDFLKEKKVTHVLIRQGIPFVPSFLIAYLIILSIGNWFLLL